MPSNRLLPYVALYVVVAHLLWPLQGQEPVFGLADKDCQAEVLIAVIEEAHVFASCTSEGGERMMQVSVRNLAPADKGPLRDFSIGFCGQSVIRASGPTGWATKIEGDIRQHVTWSLPDDSIGSLGIASGVKATGFSVRLKPGWKRSQSDSAWWGEWKMVAQLTTHDC